MQLVTSVSITSTPSERGPRAAAAGYKLAGDEGLAVAVASAEHQRHQLAGTVGRHALGQHLLQRAQDAARDALDGGRPRVDRRGLERIDDAALRQLERDRPEAAGIGRDRGIGDRAHGVAGRRERARRHAIERPAHLRRGAGEVAVEGAVLHRHRDLEADAFVEIDAVIVAEVDIAVGAGRDASAAPPASGSRSGPAARRRSRAHGFRPARRRGPRCDGRPHCRPRAAR